MEIVSTKMFVCLPVEVIYYEVVIIVIVLVIVVVIIVVVVVVIIVVVVGPRSEQLLPVGDCFLEPDDYCFYEACFTQQNQHMLICLFSKVVLVGPWGLTNRPCGP